MSIILSRLQKLAVVPSDPQDAAAIARPSFTFPSPQFSTSIKYLAYGSNLSAETFLGGRGIKPLSQVNVTVPSLELMFDLAGIPYFEPRFANVRVRADENDGRMLTGVVYEVTQDDYRKILVSEGGYDKLSVRCHPIPSTNPSDRPVPESFDAMTLIIYPKGTRAAPGQPSLRYLTLLIHGAQEHGLPEEYQNHLSSLHYYHTTTLRQRIGGTIYLALWAPLVALMFLLVRATADAAGQPPAWVAAYQRFVFVGVWMGYDAVWKHMWGNGEMTTGGKGETSERKVLEEEVKLFDQAQVQAEYGTVEKIRRGSVA